jgi:hypothetical protein
MSGITYRLPTGRICRPLGDNATIPFTPFDGFFRGLAILLEDPRKNAMQCLQMLDEMDFIDVLDLLIGIELSINEQKSTFLTHANDCKDHDRQGKLSCWSIGGIISLTVSMPNPLPSTMRDSSEK